jgi:hypothetical protein
VSARLIELPKKIGFLFFFGRGLADIWTDLEDSGGPAANDRQPAHEVDSFVRQRNRVEG